MRLARLAVLPLLFLAGCLDREETIQIEPDGSCTLQVQAKGDPNDVRTGDSLPSQATGWEVAETTTRDAEGKETLTLTAKRSIPSGAPLPGSYAPAGDPAEPLALAFPTTVEIDRRTEGAYYHFRRVYAGREWNAVEYYRTRLMETDEMKKIAGKEPSECTREERATLVHALLDLARNETSTYLHQAQADLKPPLPQQAFLDALRSAMAPYEKATLPAQAIDLLARGATDEIVALAVQIEAEVKQATEASLRASGLPETSVRAFSDRTAFHRQRREIANDLGDENWQVTVILPGKIVGHNGLDAPAGAETGRVTWKFDGKALLDRDVVLMASSFVPRGEDEGK